SSRPDSSRTAASPSAGPAWRLAAVASGGGIGRSIDREEKVTQRQLYDANALRLKKAPDARNSNKASHQASACVRDYVSLSLPWPCPTARASAAPPTRTCP